MNGLSIPGGPAWFDALVILSAQATLLAVIVWAIVKLLGRWIPPNWRALLWFVVIARALVPIAPPSPFSLQNFFVRPVATKPTPPAPARVEFTDDSRQVDLQTTRGVINSTVFLPPDAVRAKPVDSEINPAKALAFVWACGAVLFIALLAARSLIIRRRLIRHGCAPDLKMLEMIEGCRAELGLRFPIRITVSDGIAAPALSGLIPARLILPSSFNAVEFAPGQSQKAREDARPPSLGEREFTSTQVRQILLHELAHVKQGHLLLHWLALIARALHWFNPAIHLAAAGLRHECELAADAAALNNSTSEEREVYGETILQVLSHSNAPRTLLAIGMADRARHLEQRLRALNRPNRRAYHIAGLTALCATCLAGLSGAQTQTHSQANLTANESAAPNRPVSVNTVPAIAATNNARLQEASHTTNRVPVFGGDVPIIGRLFQSEHATNHSEGAAAPGRLVAEADADKSTADEFAQSKARLAERDKLIRKIDTIRIDDFPLTTPVDLLEVVKELSFETRKRDPENRGVNFVLDKAKGRAANLKADLDRFKIKIDPPVRDVTVRQLCEVIVRVATPPPDSPESATLEYAVADYGIVFSARSGGATQMVSRSFKVDPNAFRQGLEGVFFSSDPFRSPSGHAPESSGGFSSFGQNENVQPGGRSYVATPTNAPSIEEKLRKLLRAAGVDFPPKNVAVGGAVPSDFGRLSGPPESPQNAIFFNDRAGVLFVRATQADLDRIESAVHVINAQPKPLDTVEHAIHTLNSAPPQVNFAIEVFDLPHEEGIRLGKELENQTPSPATNEFLFVYSKQRPGFDPVLILSKDLVNKIPDPTIAASVIVPGVQAIVPRSKAQALRKAFQSGKDVNGVTTPNVLTLLRRQARISIEETSGIATAKTMKSGGVPAPLGWVFDCFPMAFDGTTLEMECSAGDSEFAGYNNVGDMHAPTFHVRAMGIRTKIAPGDSQALLMPVAKAKSVPTVQDIPNLGRLLEEQNGTCRFALILITPTIVDAAGNIVFPKAE